MKFEEINPVLVRKYNQPVPRYTSYPTVPNWTGQIDRDKWADSFCSKFETVNHTDGISLYIHLPFCESLCTYCGCNKKITTNHSVENEYIDAIEKEWQLYRKMMKQTPVIREIHLGGGTPTFFSAKNLEKLLNIVLKTSIIHPRYEFSFEAHPNNTTELHLKTLFNKGFRRLSLGVQDNDPEVQVIINRIQPFENVRRVTEMAREIGYTSINFDLIYGLPRQTIQSIENTIREVITAKPDRIAFYSYAHVPWASRGQRLFDENDLPAPEEKIQLYLKGKQMLLRSGYYDIGMDHFSLDSDELYKARQAGTLNRNFMGYTTKGNGLLLGLGVSAICDIGTAYAQNEKAVHDYYTSLRSGNLPIRKGYFLSEDDQLTRKYILDIACRGWTKLNAVGEDAILNSTMPLLTELEKDGLVEIIKTQVRVTAQGHYFIRNICSAFDMYLQHAQNEKQVYSKAI